MQDKELYRQLLGLEGLWKVSEVEINLDKSRIDVWIRWPEKERIQCPECGKLGRIYYNRKERKWRHLDTMQFQTILHCAVPRVECSVHGVKSISVPWSEKHSHFTTLFERLSIDVLLACQNQTKAKELLKLSWDEVHKIQEKAVERGLSYRLEKERAEYIGIDEKSFLKKHKYATVVYNLDEAYVVEVAKDRKEESLSEIFKKMPEKQREKIKAVALDMWTPYMNVVQRLLPDADIVHDKFHIAKHLGEAVDRVRKTENKALRKEGVDTLSGTKYLWLTNPCNWTKEQKRSFKELKDKELKVSRAWAIKEMFSALWRYVYEKAARNFFKKWYWWTTHSRLKPMAEVAKMIKRHLDNILTYLKHRITNAVAEGINSKIQQIKSAARGFRNFKNYRNSYPVPLRQIGYVPT